MEKIRINSGAFPYPMPMVLVGSDVDDKPNFMPVAWVNRAHPNPPMLMVAAGKRHHTNIGIHEYGEFGVSIPTRRLLEATDYCGLVSGREVDKSGVFTVFRGGLEHAPMAGECPLAMECRVYTTVDLPDETIFVGEIVSVFSEERYLVDGRPDIRAIDPFMLSMPDNHYWSLGEIVGDAWGSGRNFRSPEE